MAELASAIGAEAACEVSRQFGGTTIQGPREPSPDHYLSKAVGIDLARQLCLWLNGGRFYVPKQWGLHRQARELLQAGSLTIREIARRTTLSDRTIYRIKNRGDAAPLPERDDRQPDLFG